MSSIAVQGGATGTGLVTVVAPSTSINRTLTLPDVTATLLSTATPGVPVNGPAFSAYGSAIQSITNGTYTKIVYNTEEFDTNSCYDTSAYRFTPTVAGYYQINAACDSSTSATGGVLLTLYKNGSMFKTGSYYVNNNFGPRTTLSCVVYANGTTDYFEIFGWQSSGANMNFGSGSQIFAFSAAMVRAA